jgi:phosphoadenosine phosphosulfate reductase
MTTPQFEMPIALPISAEELQKINGHLSELTPEDILRWAVDHLPGLFQTTAFGATGLVAIDMLSKITKKPPPLIFIDTLYHFPETYELVEEAKKKYGIPIHVYKPEGCADVREFEGRHGKELWKIDETAYDYYVKVNADPFLVQPLLTLGMIGAGRASAQGIRGVGGESGHYWS